MADHSESKSESKSNKDLQEEMTDEEKLMMFESELKAVYKQCVDEGYSPEQIEVLAQPLLARVDQANRKKLFVRLAKVAIIVAMVSILVQYEPLYEQICIHSKLLSIKMLPIFNWAKVYNWECLVENPLYDPGTKLTPDDCKQICKKYLKIPRTSNLSHNNMEKLLKNERPVIVTDGIRDWPISKNISIKSLAKMYIDEPKLAGATGCGFGTSIRVNWPKPIFVLGKAIKQKKSNWYLFWENCDIDVVKYMRKLYRRPYFFPPMVEMMESNWFMVGSNYTDKYVFFTIEESMITWIAQVKGKTNFKLKPNEPCNKICHQVKDTLKTGEILMYSNELWEFSYQPQGNQSIAIAVGARYDEL